MKGVKASLMLKLMSCGNLLLGGNIRRIALVNVLKPDMSRRCRLLLEVMAVYAAAGQLAKHRSTSPKCVRLLSCGSRASSSAPSKPFFPRCMSSSWRSCSLFQVCKLRKLQGIFTPEVPDATDVQVAQCCEHAEVRQQVDSSKRSRHVQEGKPLKLLQLSDVC